MWRPTISSDVIYHSAICHSAKGSTWKNHKYLKKIGNAYVYAKAAFNAKKKRDKEFKNYDAERIAAGFIGSNKDFKSRKYDGSDGTRPQARLGQFNKEMDQAANNHIRRAGVARTNYYMYDDARKSYKKLAKGQLKSLGNEISSDITNSINKGKKMVGDWLEKKKRKKRAKKTAAAEQAKGKNRTWNETARHGKTITEKKIREKRITEKRR